MTDKELADRIIALGVGSISVRDGDNEYCIMAAFIRADKFVRDWRVAGALMEKCGINTEMSDDWTWVVGAWKPGGCLRKANNESLPRAINEACCAALS